MGRKGEVRLARKNNVDFFGWVKFLSRLEWGFCQFAKARYHHLF